MKKFKSLVREIFITLLIAILIYLSISFFFRLGKVDGSSMEHTYSNGDFVLINRQARDFEKNDIVTFIYSEENNAFYKRVYYRFDTSNNSDMVGEQHIKRIVGVGGDHIVINNGVLYVNDQEIVRSELSLANQDYYLAEDELFVLGDNTNNSFDSRQHGPIKTNQVYGKIITNK